ncbi:MAG TPA: TlpA disulfide reductase family protein [Candidatus Methylomirabilis sp.]|nr:TlpA disulfide reductase family protein [Candidatus Methylomirabilis sp.]
MKAPGGVFLYHGPGGANKQQLNCTWQEDVSQPWGVRLNTAKMVRKGIKMKLRAGVAALVLSALAVTTAAQQAKAPSDPKLIDAQGFQQVLAQYRGKALLVNFWATWCEPCRDEYPMLNELAKQYGPKGLNVVGVSLDNDGDIILMRRFLARYKPIFTNYRKKPGDDAAAFRESILPGWTGSLPITIFYGKNGRQVATFVGEKPREQYEQVIQGLLEAGGGSGR